MTDTKTLIVGASGMIGKSLSSALEAKGKRVLRASRSSSYKIDLNEFERSVFEDVGQVVFCSTPNYKLPQEFLDQIFQGASSFLKACAEEKVPVVFLSTNLVFDGLSLAKPSDSKNPFCLYGKHKSELEKIVGQQSDNAIVRIAKVIGPQTLPFFDWCDQLANNRTISVFSNLTISPISLSFVTKALTQIVSEQRSGVFHLSSQDQMSFASVIEAMAERLQLNPKLVQRVQADSETFLRANRQSGLDCKETVDALGLQMPFAIRAINEFCDGLATAENVRTVPYV